MKAAGAQPLRVSLTNVLGLGATELAKSLMPALSALPEAKLGDIHVPEAGSIKELADAWSGRAIVYHRHLPKPLSRILECTLLGCRFDGDTPLLVMGDIPIATASVQAVFVQSPHLVRRSPANTALDSLRYRAARALFRRNIRHANAFIVQSEAMRSDLLATYPAIKAETVHVIPQPPPSWLLAGGVKRTKARPITEGLRLFYPAAAYPHKNHILLQGLATDWPHAVEQITLTIDPDTVPGLPSRVQCVGRLGSDAVIAEYDKADALLFLSKAESFGFPLVEAMWLGLPVLCADLPYARVLCGDQAIYFDPDSQDSLRAAVDTLRTRLQTGWWPDWRNQLAVLPRDWNAVAADIVRMISDLSGPP